MNYAPTHIQPKLKIGHAHDAAEQEADAIAEEVTRPLTGGQKPGMRVGHMADGGIQRKCAACEEEQVQRKPMIQAKAGAGAQGGLTAPAQVTQGIHATRGGGSALDGSVRQQMEGRFGMPLGGVRIHTGDYAAQLSAQVNARAFTVGNDIYFNRGEYQPSTPSGQKLLAHELVHTVQQGGRGLEHGPLRRFPGEASDQENTNQGEIAGSPGSTAEAMGACDPWVQDGKKSPGDLYYRTEPEAKKRKDALEQIGEYKQYRVAAFVSGGTTYYRVEMCGLQKPGTKTAPKAGSEPGAADDDKQDAPKKDDTQEKPKVQQGPTPVCMTFDDGPILGATDDVLSALGSNHGIFFLTGSNLASNPAEQYRLVRAILDKKHQIANHSYTHSPMRKDEYKQAGPQKVVQDFQKNKKHFEDLFTANKDQLPGFSHTRLPGDGRTFPNIVDALEKDTGVPHISWNFEFAPNGKFGHVKNNDWQGITGVAATSSGMPPANAIILLHDAHWKGKQALLKSLVDFLIKQGNRFGKLDTSGKCV